MSRIYLDNAATSFPKPPEVAEAVFDYMTGSGSSINRGCYSTAYQVEEMVYETRLLLCNLFGGHDPAEVVFTKNVTESLNILMKGLLKPGDHVLVSAMEHNAVMRPLRQLEKKGVSFTRIPCGHDGRLLTPSSMSGDSRGTQSHSSGSMHDGSHGTQSPSSVSVLAEDNDDLLLPSSSMYDDSHRTQSHSSCSMHDGNGGVQSLSSTSMTDDSCDERGSNAVTDSTLDPVPDYSFDSFIGSLLTPNTRAVIMTHASNVCGTVFPIEKIGQFCKEHGLLFILDTAQTAGVLDIDMKKMHIDALVFTGHKGLLGPQGIGGFILSRHLAEKMEPLLSGGTGSFSHTEELPETLPDRFEAGTPNLPGIAGLNAALKWLNKKSTAAIYDHELCLTKHFIDSILPLEDQGLLRIVGIKNHFSVTSCERIGVVSVQTAKHDLSDIAYRLDDRYGIQTRVGLHCAPSAHKTLGTYPTGTIRFSFGWANTYDDCDIAAAALAELCK